VTGTPNPSEQLELVTIVAEPLLKSQLLEAVVRLGATGYSVSQAEGRNARATAFEGANVRIETVVSHGVAELILHHLAEQYFEHYSVVAWAHPVRVVRSAKFH
jgi:hypothetical protein